ncbi:MAG: amidohydrolase [Bacteroidota bacterium]|nr:amidohydrolase [Bacteroidota bacterium]
MSSLTITIIQTDLFWEDKKANLEMLQKKIESISEKTEIVILPEMFTTGFTMKPKIFSETMEGKTMQWMKNISAKKKIILTGSIIIEENAKYFNRLIWMLPTGEYGFYDKRHLFAYAGEHMHYSAGNKKLITSVKGWKINLQVCYDLRFPVWARQSAHSFGEGLRPEYDLLINVANWPQKRSLAWKTLLAARAIENQCYVIGVNRIGQDGNEISYYGDSMIIDPLGEIIYQKNKEEDIFTYTLQKEKIEETRNHFPFWKDADSFIINP